MKPIRPSVHGVFPDVFGNLHKAVGSDGTLYEYRGGSSHKTFSGEVALGNGTQYRFRMFWHGEWLVVAILEKGAYEFDGYVHWAYAMEKLGLKFEGDAQNVADFINDQFQNKEPRERQGSYDIRFCSDGQG